MTIFMQNVLAMSSGSAGPQSYWLTLIGGTGDEKVRCVDRDSSGNIYFVGDSTSSGGAGASDSMLGKLDSNGNLLWLKSFGQAGSDIAVSIKIGSSGSLFVGGTTSSSDASYTNNDIFVWKLDADGNPLFQKKISGSGGDYTMAMEIDSSENIYLAGATDSSGGAGSWDNYLIKLNSSGTSQWQRSWGSAGDDQPRGIKVDSSGNVYVSGYTNSSGGAGSYDAFILKYNSSGVLQWAKSVGGASNEFGLSLALDSSQNPIMATYTNSIGAGDADCAIIKFDTSGAISWQKIIGGTGTEYPWSVFTDSANNVYCAATTKSQGQGNEDILLVKTDSSGTLLWQRTFGGNGVETLSAMCGSVVSSEGALFIPLSTNSAGAGGYDAGVLKLPADGSLTGSYGHFTYKASTLTFANASFSATTRSLTEQARSLTIADTNYSTTNRTLTSTKTSLDTLPSFWISTLGTASADDTGELVLDSSGNIFHLTRSNSFGNYDLVLSKLNSAGAVQWSKRIVASVDETNGGFAIDSQNNLYICATTTSTGAGGNDIYVAKLDSTGAIVWQKTLGGTGDDSGTGIAVDSSGNVFVSGITNSQGAGNYDAFIAKLDSSGTVQWQRSLGGSNDDRAYGIGVDSSGNAYLGGWTLSQTAGASDFLIAKYNTSGTLQWQRTVGGATNYDSSYGMCTDASGNVYLSGLTTIGNYDMVVVKYDTNGTIQWQRQLTGAGPTDIASAVAVDASGNVYLSGYTDTSGVSGGADAFMAKYDSAGTILWQRALGGSGNDYNGGRPWVDSQGSIYFPGTTTSAGAGDRDSFIAKLPADGSLTASYGNMTYRSFTLTASTPTLTDAARTLTDAARTLTVNSVPVSTVVEPGYWISTLGGSGDENLYECVADSTGNLYALGHSSSQGAGGYDILLVKYNASGTVQWQKLLGGAGTDMPGYGMALDSSGNIAISARTASQGAGGDDALVAKYDSSGNLLWQRVIGGSGAERMDGIAFDSSGNVIAAGSTASQGAGGIDALITKYDASGTLLWQRTLGGSGADYFLSAGCDSSGNAYGIGHTASQGAGGNDLLIAKYNSSGTLQWQRSLGGAANETSWGGGTVDSSGNVYITGFTASQSAGSQDILVAKYDTNGTVQWQRRIGSSVHEEAPGVSVDSSGNVYVSGYSGASGDTVVVVKYDANGTLQWQRSFGGSGLDSSIGVSVASNTLFVVGATTSAGAGGNDAFVLRVPTDGSCTGTYGSFTYAASSYTEAATTLTAGTTTLTDSACTLTAGTATLTSQSASLTASRTTIANTFASVSLTVGTTAVPVYWIGTLGGSGTEYGIGSAVDSSDNVYIVGQTSSQGSGSDEIVVAKYNSSGALQWQRLLGGAAAEGLTSEGGNALALDSSNNVYVVARTASQGAGGNDILLAKYNSSGTLQWQRSLGGSGTENGFAVAVGASGSVYVGGTTTSQGAGSNDLLVAKYNSSGTIQWQRSLGGTTIEEARAICVDSSENVYLAGYTNSQSVAGDDGLIVKYSSSGTLQWQRTLGGTGSDYLFGIAADSSNNVYVTGTTNSQGAGSNDLLIAKYNSSGAIQWQRSLGGTGVEYGHAATVDSLGQVYVVGYTNSQGAGVYDVLIAKYDSAGTIQWQRSLGGTGEDRGWSANIGSQGNLVVVGYTASAGAGGNDILVAKLPSDGSATGTYGSFTYAARTLTDAARTLTDSARTLTDSARTLTDSASTLTDQAASLDVTRTTIASTIASSTQSIVTPPSYWISTLGGSGTDQSYGTAVGPSGAVYVAGISTSVGDSSNQALLVKYNSAGAVQWQKTLGNVSTGDTFNCMAVDSSENIYTAGWTTSQGAGTYEGLLCRYDSDGNLQWQRSLGGSGEDFFRRVTTDTAGNVFVTGWTMSQGAGGEDLLIAKYNSSGVIQWQRSLGGASNDNGYGIGTDASGNVYVVGQTASQGAGNADAMIVKYNSSGTIQWQRSLGGAGNEEPFCTVDSSGNVYLCGITSSQGAGGEDILIAKYNSSGTIQWQRSLGGTGTDQGRGIAIDAMGNLYIVGSSNSTGGAGNNDMIIAKYDTSGTIQWQRSFGGSGNDNAMAVAIDSTNGALYVCGHTASAGAGGDDILLVRLPVDGSLTGTYGSFTYQARTLTDAARTLTDAARTLTDAPRTLTDSARTLTAGTASLTANKTTVQ